MRQDPSPLPSEAFVQCPNCGFKNPIGATLCEGCDAGSLEILDVAKEPPPVVNAQAKYPRVQKPFPSEYDNHPLVAVLRVCLWVVGILAFLFIAYFGTWFVAGGGSFD